MTGLPVLYQDSLFSSLQLLEVPGVHLIVRIYGKYSSFGSSSFSCWIIVIPLIFIDKIQIVVRIIFLAVGRNHSLRGSIKLEDDFLFDRIIKINCRLLAARIISVSVLEGDLFPVLVVETDIKGVESLHKILSGEEENTVVCNNGSYLLSESRGPSLIVVTPGTLVDLRVPRISHLINSVTVELISAKESVSVARF